MLWNPFSKKNSNSSQDALSFPNPYEASSVSSNHRSAKAERAQLKYERSLTVRANEGRQTLTTAHTSRQRSFAVGLMLDHFEHSIADAENASCKIMARSSEAFCLNAHAERLLYLSERAPVEVIWLGSHDGPASRVLAPVSKRYNGVCIILLTIPTMYFL